MDRLYEMIFMDSEETIEDIMEATYFYFLGKTER